MTIEAQTTTQLENKMEEKNHLVVTKKIKHLEINFFFAFDRKSLIASQDIYGVGWLLVITMHKINISNRTHACLESLRTIYQNPPEVSHVTTDLYTRMFILGETTRL